MLFLSRRNAVKTEMKLGRELVEVLQIYHSFTSPVSFLPLHFSLLAQRKTKQKERAPCCFGSI
jgi:2-hydroxychromene-2-carboxylate isomerase